MPKVPTWTIVDIPNEKGPSQSLGRMKKPAAYLFFILIVTYFFLYLAFPGKIARQFLKGFVKDRFPALSLRMKEVSLSLPLGVRLEHPRLLKEINPSRFLFEADDLVITPSTKMVLSGRPTVGFDCRAYGGRIEGITVFRRFGLGPPFRMDMNVSDFHIGRYALLQERLNRKCTGIMQATLAFEQSGKDPLQGQGQADISISNGSIVFSEPFFGLSSLNLEKIEAQVVLKDRTMVLNNATFRGPQVTGEANGIISLKRTLAHSSLDLTVAFKPAPGFLENNDALIDAAKAIFKNSNNKDHWMVKIKGTISQPRTSFL